MEGRAPRPHLHTQSWEVWGREGKKGTDPWGAFLCNPFYRAFLTSFLTASLGSYPEPGPAAPQHGAIALS